jgi:hypothetical protein
MAKREISMVVCTNCLDEFPRKETYTVSRKMHRGVEENHDEYYTPYCEDCLKDKKSYLRIIKSPEIKEKKK